MSSECTTTDGDFAGMAYQAGPAVQTGSGLCLQTFTIPERTVQARSLTIDLAQVNLRLAISPELIDRSFAPHTSADPNQLALPPTHNSGLSLPIFLEKLHASAALQHLEAACNCLHTNFVRGNGFVFRQGRLIYKPPGALALDALAYQALNGTYTALQLHPTPPAIIRIRLRDNRAVREPAPWLAISGPQLVRDGRSIAAGTPVRLPPQGPAVGDEINFDPQNPANRASFTALGLTREGRLLILSTFAGTSETVPQRHARVFHSQPGAGLTLVELAEWLMHLGARQAILGGGSGDTQQHIRGEETWVSLPRRRPGRIQVAGEGDLGAVRGLGAILLINS
jgi:hypothetical protein